MRRMACCVRTSAWRRLGGGTRHMVAGLAPVTQFRSGGGGPTRRRRTGARGGGRRAQGGSIAHHGAQGRVEEAA